MRLSLLKISTQTLLQAVIIFSPFAMLLVFTAVAFADGSTTTVTVDTSAIDEAICWLMYFQEGSYGALLMAVSALGAVVGAALGNYRTAINCLVVAVGTWLIQPVAVLMFGYWPGMVAGSKTCFQVVSVPMGMTGN